MSGRVEVALAVPLREGRLLVGRRQAGSHLEGLWEFPGGKIDDGETPAVAAGRELQQETRLIAGELQPLIVIAHDYTERAVRLHVFVADDLQGEPAGNWSWKTLAELERLEMPAANDRILVALRWRVP